MLQFGWEVTRPIGADVSHCIKARWYTVLYDELKYAKQHGSSENGLLVDLKPFNDALASTDRHNF